MLRPPRRVAASDFRPLCNIPHCCPPQGYGPCLSSIVADHPLRPANHHRLGELLPHQLTSSPHPPPRAINLSSAYFHFAERMRDYLPFDSCPPLQGRLSTCYAPVCHATKCVRLACVRPPASVHPEPGSNSSKKNFYEFVTQLYLFLLTFLQVAVKLYKIVLLQLYLSILHSRRTYYKKQYNAIVFRLDRVGDYTKSAFYKT